jgi:hypothetical protein
MDIENQSMSPKLKSTNLLQTQVDTVKEEEAVEVSEEEEKNMTEEVVDKETLVIMMPEELIDK